MNVISNRPREEIKWTTNAIKTILTNEIYLGHLIQGKRTTISYKNHKIRMKNRNEWIRRENTHEAIIDEETFHKVQVAIKERTKPMKATGNVHIFSGKVFCLECKHYMRKKNSTKHEYLVCSGNRDGYDDCINKASIRYDWLSDVILESINEKLCMFYDKEELKNLDLKNETNPFSSKIKALEKQKQEIENKIVKNKKYLKNTYEDKVNGVITAEQFKDLIVGYNKSEKVYNRQIQSIDNELSYYHTKEEFSKNNEKSFDKYKEFNELHKVIIDEFIDRIYIGKIDLEKNTRTIQIKWNFE